MRTGGATTFELPLAVDAEDRVDFDGRFAVAGAAAAAMAGVATGGVALAAAAAAATAARVSNDRGRGSLTVELRYVSFADDADVAALDESGAATSASSAKET